MRYELLDCNHAFLDSAMKLVDLMEHGAVKGGERLVPHLFQFLVLLANDQSKLVTVPQVCVKYISCVCRYTNESKIHGTSQTYTCSTHKLASTRTLANVVWFAGFVCKVSATMHSAQCC